MPEIQDCFAFEQLDFLVPIQIQGRGVDFGGLGAVSRESHACRVDLDREDIIESFQGEAVF